MFTESEELPQEMPDIPAAAPETPHHPSDFPFADDDEAQEAKEANQKSENPEPEPKRNCGHTGATTEAGRATCSQNARKHGSCSRLLILPTEDYNAWLDLLSRWEATYPSENPLVADFVLKTATAEWHRIRVENSYNSLFSFLTNPNVFEWQPHEQKQHDLALRYLTAAERRFQREFRMLEQFYSKHGGQPAGVPKPTRAEESAKARAAEEAELAADVARRKDVLENLKFVNNETGEWFGKDNVVHPPPPGWKPAPIVPGQYPPDHPTHGPKPLFLQKKRR